MSEVWGQIEAAGLAGAGRLAGLPAKDCRKQLFDRLNKLASSKVCARQAPWWVTIETNGGAFAIKLSGSADGLFGSHPCVLLNELELLQDGAKLTFHVHVDPTANPPAQYSAGLVGRVRETSEEWFARIDLGGIGDGKGRCSHPLLHAHVGANPDAPFQARVPLHPLMPWEAVDWLLATADARFEPCPHE